MAKRLSIIKALVITGVLIAIFLPGFSKMQELHSRNRLLQEEILNLRLENQRLQEERDKLKDDLDYIEKKARQKMGVVKKGEIIYRIVPEGTTKK